MAEDETPRGSAQEEPEDEVEGHIGPPRTGRPGANEEPEDEVEGHIQRTSQPPRTS